MSSYPLKFRVINETTGEIKGVNEYEKELFSVDMSGKLWREGKWLSVDGDNKPSNYRGYYPRNRRIIGNIWNNPEMVG